MPTRSTCDALRERIQIPGNGLGYNGPRYLGRGWGVSRGVAPGAGGEPRVWPAERGARPPVEAAPPRGPDDLKKRVAERTAALSRANARLQAEIAERTRAEEV